MHVYKWTQRDSRAATRHHWQVVSARCRQLVLRKSWHHFVSQQRPLSQYRSLPLTSRLRGAACGRARKRVKGTKRAPAAQAQQPLASRKLRKSQESRAPLQSVPAQEQLSAQCRRTIGWVVQRLLTAAIRQFIIPAKSGLPVGILSRQILTRQDYSTLHIGFIPGLAARAQAARARVTCRSWSLSWPSGRH